MQMKAVLRQREAPASFSSPAAQALDRRRSHRRALKLAAMTSSATGDETPVLVLDISEGGLLLEAAPHALSPEDSIEISLPDGAVNARIAWQSGRFFGCWFEAPVSPAAVAAALLKSEPAAPKEPVVELEKDLPSANNRVGFQPEINWSATLFLALGLWGLIGTAVVFLL